jgi:hypothetical protein
MHNVYTSGPQRQIAEMSFQIRKAHLLQEPSFQISRAHLMQEPLLRQLHHEEPRSPQGAVLGVKLLRTTVNVSTRL